MGKDFKIYGHYNSSGLFYVGATSKRYRQNDRFGRSDKWNEHAKNGWYSVVLIDGLTKEEASDIEELCVRTWRDSLANLRDGGLFGTTWKHTETTKNKLGRSVIDVDTGTVYPSVKKCAEAIGMTRSKLKHQLRGTVKNKTSIRYYE